MLLFTPSFQDNLGKLLPDCLTILDFATDRGDGDDNP